MVDTYDHVSPTLFSIVCSVDIWDDIACLNGRCKAHYSLLSTIVVLLNGQSAHLYYLILVHSVL